MVVKKTVKTGSAVVNTEGATLHSAPSVNAPIVTNVNKGERV